MTFFNSAWAIEAERSIAAYINRRNRLVARLRSVLLGRFVYDGR